ncbi:MAG: hypothetical protein GC160_04385 [Acidobacteria bacterium]|nr:hypothetical protein [Acidobacteriota bacterium]
MFGIVDGRTILRIREAGVSIGSAPEDGIRLPRSDAGPQSCDLRCDPVGVWRIRNLDGARLLFNGTPIPRGSSVQCGPSCDLTLGSRRIHLRRPTEASPISGRLAEKLFEIEKALHTAVLDRLRNVSPDEDDAEGRRRHAEELNGLIRELRIAPELEAYLAMRAVEQLLMDRIHGRETDTGSPAEAGRRTERSRLLEIIEQRIDLAADHSKAERTERVRALLPWLFREQGDALSGTDRRLLSHELLRQHLSSLMFGLGPLQDLMSAPNITEVMVLPTGRIFVEEGGRMLDSGRVMLSPEVSRRIVERVVSRQGRRIDQSSPMVDSRLKDGSRLNAVIPPVAVLGPALTIRRFAATRLGLADLAMNGTITRGVADFLQACVLARKNLVISGGTGTGKTTLLNALASCAPAEERIVTVEDTAELSLSQPNVVALQARPPNMEGEAAIGIRQLVRNTLRMRPHRVIVGECRGGEALDMLQAMNTGHDGSMTTVHANSPADAMRRLEVMALEAEGVNLPASGVREQVASAVQVIVQISRVGPGMRRVVSISEVLGIEEEDGELVIEQIFRYRKRKTDQMLPPRRLVFTGHVPSFMPELLDVGAKVECLFQEGGDSV